MKPHLLPAAFIIGLAAALAPSAAAAPDGGDQGHGYPKGEKSISIGAGYAGYNTSGLVGVEFTYRFNRYLRIAPGADYVFRHNGADALAINLNFHVPVALSDKFEIFPLAGLKFDNWNFHPTAADTEDVSTRKSRFGLNVGAGLGWRASGRLRLSLTADYVVIKQFGGAEVMARIGYAF